MGSASAPGTREPVAAASSPSGSAAHATPTRAQALAIARAVNLNAADIPGASIAPRAARRSSARERAEYRACERSVDHGHVLDRASSPKLKRGSGLETEQIGSTVTVLGDASGVKREFSQLGRPAVLECIAQTLTHNFAEKSVREAHWGSFTVSRLPVKAVGASATVGAQIAATLNFSLNEVSVPIYFDVLAFATGSTEVSLSAASVTQPVPGTTEQELLALLLARADARTG